MITSGGKVLQVCGRKFCVKCNEIRDQTYFSIRYRKPEKNDDAYEMTDRRVCDRCHNESIIVKKIPIPTDKAMLVKLLMSLNEKYELAGSTIEVRFNEVRAIFRFREHDLPKLRQIANNWAERGYINAKHLLMLQKAAMADVAKIPPRWAPSIREARREAMRRIFDE